MKPLWTFTPGGAIWRVHPAVKGRIVGESRDLADRSASFFAVDVRTGKALWRGLTLEQPWWVGMEGVEGDTLFVHGYANPTLPVHRGLTAIDIPSGSVRWSNAAWTPGAPLEEGIAASDETWKSTTLFPDTIAVGALGGHRAGGRVLQEWPAETLTGVVEVLVLGETLIVAATERPRSGDPRHHVHHMRILPLASGRALYTDLLSGQAGGVSTDAFFVQDGLLVYVKGGKELCALDVRHLG